MVCSACNATNADDAMFCEACGSSLAARQTDDTAVAPDDRSPGRPQAEFLPGEAPSHRIGQSTTVEMTVRPCVACGGAVEDEYCTVCGAKQPSPRDHYEIVHSATFAGVCDRGIQHSANQDAMSIAPGDSAFSGVLVVCDGVTSAPLSERAALAATGAACEALASRFSTNPTERTSEFWAAALRASCTAAQAETVAIARTLGDPPEPPSCTFVAAVVDAQVVHVGCCGDSRAYWLPDSGEGQILTADDSIATQLIAAGTSRAEAESDPRAHTITRWLGADAPDPSATVATVKLNTPGWVAVVSDGMWNYASEPVDLKATMVVGGALTPTPAITIAKAMVAFANEQGGADNVTVALFRFDPDQTEPPTVTGQPPATL